MAHTEDISISVEPEVDATPVIQSRDQRSLFLWQQNIQNKSSATKLRQNYLLLKVFSHICLDRENPKDFMQVIQLVLQDKAPSQPSASMSEIPCMCKRKCSLTAVPTFQPGRPNLPVSQHSCCMLVTASSVHARYEQPGTLTPGYSLLTFKVLKW